MNLLAPIVGLIWAGLSLGGNIIAAAAKFQISGLSYQILLQIGRAQFSWLAYAEWALLALLCFGLVFIPRVAPLFFVLPIGLFLAQRFWLMPLLNERTTQIIANQTVPDSSLHLVFIALEAAKLLALIVASIMVIRRLS